MSRFWRTADGWVRTHANYPHHRARLLRALGMADNGRDEALVDPLAKELAAREALEIQETVYAEGGLAVAVATEPAPPGLPLIEAARIGEGGPASRLPLHPGHALTCTPGPRRPLRRHAKGAADRDPARRPRNAVPRNAVREDYCTIVMRSVTGGASGAAAVEWADR
ncbi:hypothetical protein ACFYPN_26335 [Streptomyces sp. NPDC005576]|uniref:hypothetical protein n=1 Tax=Streptomyces sp. NPDC005576 TaxID=3364726 RepID=UPI00368E2AF5